MSSEEKRFLPHLENSLPKSANNYMLSTYSIILEAWRRGLNITIRILREASGNIEPYFTLSDGTKSHQFSVTRGDKVSVEAKKLTKNKFSTKEYLTKNNVPNPEGKLFEENSTNQEIISYAETFKYPVVLKPLQGTGGKGVIANIKNKEELTEALEYVRGKLNSSEVLIERFFPGVDYRLYVIGDKVAAALKRLPAHVIGDGVNTISDLIKQKNVERTKVPSLSNRPIKVDDETRNLLKQNGYNLNSIPKKDETVYLKTKSNVSSGGDSIDVSGQVSDKIKEIAIAAAKSFEDLPHCGIDMIVNEDEDTGVVLEINSRAHITQHLYPLEGQARDIPSDIVDFYFPETKNVDKTEANKLYIDYDYIYDSCLQRSASEIKIPKLPSGPIKLTRFVITDCNYSIKFAKQIRRIAFNHKINGYIKSLSNGDVAIVIGGNEGNVKKFTNALNKKVKKNFSNATISEKQRKSPVKHGFTIVGDNEGDSEQSSKKISDEYFKKYSDLKNDHQKLVRKLTEFEQKEKYYNLMEKQNKNLKKRLKQMESSTSWKVTKPLRKAIKIIKK
ncbi:ATP-grasp domain-containing protein [Piscibacillus sp. B03]|uniref:ATP-grasp domain-containing protein n=1 Tax=Piscibacillus sp. B03 TaxID=3457430 RepID=UPI003FCE7E8B